MKIQINKYIQADEKNEKKLNQRIVDLLEQGCETGVFPGASAAVSWGSGVQRRRGHACAGVMDNRCPNQKVTADTFFDLASLTKALATTLILYGLINERKLKLNDTLDKFFRQTVPEDKQKISIRRLLSHTSGLVAYEPYFAACKPRAGTENKAKFVQSILAEPLAYTPGSTCVYSDFGFILLGFIIEKITGKSLDYNFKKYVTDPTHSGRDIFYLPQGTALLNSNIFAATEECPWRGKVIRGEVHDEHCWLMGGLSGHAGLFGRAGGVRHLCEHILDEWLTQGTTYAWSGMLQQGLQRQSAEQTWCLGFDTPSAGTSSGGKYISASSVGHLGYAGTSFWIDPVRELVMVLLTNRVHPSRDNTKIRDFRPYFHNAVIETLGKK